jgi:hypothetical protein
MEFNMEISLEKESQDGCECSYIDMDNEGQYGKEVCRFCGKKQRKN